MIRELLRAGFDVIGGAFQHLPYVGSAYEDCVQVYPACRLMPAAALKPFKNASSLSGYLPTLPELWCRRGARGGVCKGGSRFRAPL